GSGGGNALAIWSACGSAIGTCAQPGSSSATAIKALRIKGILLVCNQLLDRRLASACRQFEGNSRADAALLQARQVGRAMERAVPDLQAGALGPDPETTMEPKKPKRDRKRRTDDKLDRALEDTFPASDPVSFIEPAPKRENDTPLDK